ncbi:feruloyl-CoA synthase [Aquamicrobium sp. LC103]|uniref:feruloyl-CoA synthase n=1 Tax=Aquamicrobium sp. LC103 TaxID=1120658 RepID=UPI000AD66DA3|nr:feruloyl-CoA synthase [Aquamicrobium sp. LC103]TKT74720.1 feruloyl-CoA synthase [Aquamicrobium sp. LC103]
MTIAMQGGLRPVRMGSMDVETSRSADGAIYIRSRAALPGYARSLVDSLDDWADKAPDRTLFADRGPDGEWRRLSYAEARERSRAIAQYLLDRGLSAERPLVILSGNGLKHALAALGAMRAGIPYAPVSPAYSLVSKDHSKLKYIFELLTPGLVFAADGGAFADALKAVVPDDVGVVVARSPVDGLTTALFDEMIATMPTSAVDDAHSAVTADTIAKFLFTSGSTGMPKAVINTQRMVCCNQVMIASALAFLQDEPPVLVDWLPWNHTAGGNHNFGITIHNGGTMYIDDGSPTPGGIERTVRNLTEIAPTVYFNVPKGFELLCHHMSANEALRQNFYSRLQLLQYAGAGLSKHVWDALESHAIAATGQKVMIITGYGSTETAPFAATTTWPVNRPGEIGLPAHGLELKLVPNGEKLELRLRGPSITPGYWRQPDKTAESFDEEGFYRIGDALKFVDPDDAGKGLLFDGRVSEDFKLSTGTWVNLGQVRGAIVAAFAPYVRDAVLTGLNRNHVGALLFLDVEAARSIPGVARNANEKALAHDPALRALLQERLNDLARRSTGSSNFVARVIVLDTPPSIDASEMTDKGSINQRAVMARRHELVEDLYAEPVPPHVIVAERTRK